MLLILLPFQLREFKQKAIEQQSDIQRQLQSSQKEVRDVQEAFDRYKEEMSDLAETAEMASLDKEMAEEKVTILCDHCKIVGV